MDTKGRRSSPERRPGSPRSRDWRPTATTCRPLRPHPSLRLRPGRGRRQPQQGAAAVRRAPGPTQSQLPYRPRGRPLCENGARAFPRPASGTGSLRIVTASRSVVSVSIKVSSEAKGSEFGRTPMCTRPHWPALYEPRPETDSLSSTGTGHPSRQGHRDRVRRAGSPMRSRDHDRH